MRGDAEAIAEIVPERKAKLCAGFGNAEEGIAGIATCVASGSPGDFAFGDVATDVVFRPVCVKRNFRSIEDHQKVVSVGVNAPEQSIEHDGTGCASKDSVKPGAQTYSTGRGRIVAICFEIAVVVPDQAADMLLRQHGAVPGFIAMRISYVDQRIVSYRTIEAVVGRSDGQPSLAGRVDLVEHRARNPAVDRGFTPTCATGADRDLPREAAVGYSPIERRPAQAGAGQNLLQAKDALGLINHRRSP